jgi:hypothetical protein
MFCSPSKLTDAGLKKKVDLVAQTIIDSESSLCKDSPTLSYSQISERVGDLNRLRNFKRALEFEMETRGLNKAARK